MVRVMTPEHSSSTRQPDVVALEGEIDLHESPQVMERLNPLIAKQSPRIHLDLSRVSYIDSSGLATFIDAMQRIQAYGGRIRPDRHARERPQDFRDFPLGSGVQNLSERGWIGGGAGLSPICRRPEHPAGCREE